MKRQSGMTLVELVISIVIVGLVVAALYGAMSSILGRSADPLLRQQSLSLAEAYLEEILLRSYSRLDPPAGCGSGRACFNDVRDYQGLGDQPPQDVTGSALAELPGYRVAVQVAGPAAWNGVAALQVRVEVRDPSGALLTLSGYRTCYGETDDGGAPLC